jgi:zinc protease
VTRAHPDYEALELASVVLGAGTGLTGRIPQRIREREGLAYTASAAGAGLDPGRLYAYVGTSPETVARAERGVIEELCRFHAEGPTAEELDEARSYLLGREPFRRETARQWADLAAVGALYGLPLEDPTWSAERVAATTAAEVAAAVARHLDPEVLAITVGLPAAD